MRDALLFLEEFFAPQEVIRLRQFAQDHQSQFVPSEVLNDGDVRRSSVLFDVDEIRPLVTERVLAAYPWVMARLRQPVFDVRDIEVQVTSSGDGEWFKTHRDSGADAVGSRTLTFVYYCHREPRSFNGGDLRMFLPPDDDASVTITPPQNSIVFFPSHQLHEVLPVHCPSGRFEDSRLTVNGWLHR
jgi:SM-20-related protein